MRCSKHLFIWILCAASMSAAGEGYTTEELEPVGGSVSVPDGWVLQQRHQQYYMLWVVAEEIKPDSSYDVGLSIQMYIDLTGLARKSPERFMRDFRDQYSSKHQLLSSCDETDYGDFTRICFEAIETAENSGREEDHRVQYSLFWSNELDIGVATVAGAPVELWDQNADHFNAMSEVVLLDRRRFR